ncbi:unnamed protein product [Allacma fusca]|uniref:Lipase domain-containing protein n=1 Tax=Allacma fusca TaxID=39272 RepID=A0A8J2P0L4_9HEXA|nr:unnamed protein product [Allacma fusca]
MPGGNQSVKIVGGGSSSSAHFYITGTLLLGILSLCLSKCEPVDSNWDLLEDQNLIKQLDECPGRLDVSRERRKLPLTFFPIQERFIKTNLTFYMYTNATSKENGSFKKSPVISTEDLNEGFSFKILVHGFMSSCESFEKELIPEYLREYKDVHVVCLDWSYQANPQSAYSAYKPTISILPNIAKIATGFLDILQKSGLTEDFSKVHIIGFSLGAHLAGIIGSFAKKDLGSQVERITGLDPAGPEFDIHELNEIKLDKDDARFVDIIHTCSGRLGTSKDLGHVDFYMNNGKSQPRCLLETESMARIAESVTGYCSHRSAITYFWESIKNRTFNVCKCQSYKKLQKGKCTKCDDGGSKVIFGEHCTNDARGKVFVTV